ncbi:hypothetical protein AB0C12_06625 [Actinoplanes sp. NPDC048967]|uniref:hypothetical protein n=1 Tax=Actinoplanes sp. NPDC048967 TaxID=3155269 RepID=UPI0033E736EC
MSTADARFERAVLDAFRRAVGRYCTIVNAGGLDPGSLRVSVSVLTRTPMSREFGGKVHRIVHQHINAQLPRARVVSVGFAVDPALPEPGHEFLIQPPALPAPKQTLPLTSTDPPPMVPSATAHLTLRYGADFRWVCHLASAPGWVPLGRWTGRAGPDASVRLPEYATFLPRGELLYLRHDGHRVEFARSRIRPDYLVTIDGTPLHPDGRLIQAGPAGSIGYTDGTASSTLLDYHLAWEGGHG